jgi:CubicO group peptidase (beta-lactamase class C family)
MDKRTFDRATEYISKWLQFNFERDDDVGMVVGIATKDGNYYSKAFGYADKENKTNMTVDHLFRIASHSKTFTAVAIMQLQEAGKLDIDDEAVKYLPWLNQHDDERWQKVTIRQLLSHSAGVIRDGNKSDFWNALEPFPDERSFKKSVLDAPLVFDNNTKFKYSNFGFTLLGMVVSEVSGEPYNQYVTENIVKPLGLNDTGPEYNSRLKDRYVTGYGRLDAQKKRKSIQPIDTKIMSAATGFYSNAKDICSYFLAHQIGSGKLLNDESKKEMQRQQWEAENTSIKEGYGLGLEYELIGGKVVWGHGGGFPGNITKTYFDPVAGLVVTVLTNNNASGAGDTDKNIIKILGRFTDEKTEPKFEKYEGRFIDLWWDADVVALGDKLILTGAGSMEPFDHPMELEHINGNKFKISKTDSWSSPGEEVEFIMGSDGKPKQMIFAGSTMERVINE